MEEHLLQYRRELR
ncbi:hypothetical protein E2C01_089473 [Portunus trituberculatus]|uniref:Uncharacterized protein n=1 Tax=Portunus trituberculatus TaxID=210409 RepID=A0A5B7JHB1_PORTR|nr:hypothetical protein [Portunus trituberculatus]